MVGPVTKFRAGPISCAIWENDAVVNGNKMGLKKATVERWYKDSSGEWKSSGSFGRNETPLVMYCLQKAFEYMVEERSVREEEVV